MIIGIGHDLVDRRRIQKVMNRFGDRFVQRCFTPEEAAVAARREKTETDIDAYAKRFAAKEACAKALQTGFANGVYMKDIGVVNTEEGRPVLRLTGGAQRRLEALIPAGCRPVVHLSLSDEPPFSSAFVIIEAL